MTDGKRIVAQDTGIFAVIVGIVTILAQSGWVTALETAHPAFVAGIVGAVHVATRLVAASGLTGGDTSPLIGSSADSGDDD